jgi:DNA-binding transcriptional LysR family regulator
MANAMLFIRVIELGSIRAAAREANIEASSLSRKLTQLENRLDAKLLDRSHGKSVITDAGERYYLKMRALLPQLEEVEANVAGEATVPKGLLTVNAIFSPSTVMPARLRKFIDYIAVQAPLVPGLDPA